jgi:3-ketoacyl-CoA synthase
MRRGGREQLMGGEAGVRGAAAEGSSLDLTKLQTPTNDRRAGMALKKNITTLGPLVLPYSEQALFAANMLMRKLYGAKKVKPYVPNFSKAFQHICIHTGGRAVIDEIEKQLSLGREAIEPSRASLFRYGNVSSSSIWYVLAYIESTRGVRRGDMVWQVGFGSGFKCNSAVWRANRAVRSAHAAWQGFDVDHMVRCHTAGWLGGWVVGGV